MAEVSQKQSVILHSWVTEYIDTKDVGFIDEHLRQFKDVRYLVIGSHHFGQDPFYRLTKNGSWYGTCVDGNPYETENFFRNTKTIKDKVQFIFSYLVPPKHATTQKLFISKENSGKATLIKARKKEIEGAEQDIWIKCMTTTELIDIVGTNFKALQIDAEGLDWPLLKSLPRRLFKNLEHLIVETISPDLVGLTFDTGLKYVYYFDDVKSGEYWYFARQPIDKEKLDEYRLKNKNKLRNNSL